MIGLCKDFVRNVSSVTIVLRLHVECYDCVTIACRVLRSNVDCYEAILDCYKASLDCYGARSECDEAMSECNVASWV